MGEVTYSAIYEVRDIHPRVAHSLLSSGWDYGHEFHLWGRGFADFVAIHEMKQLVAIIECKRRVTSAQEVVTQIDRYHRALGIPTALKVVFTPFKPSKLNRDILATNGVLLYNIPMETPKVTTYPSTDARENFRMRIMAIKKDSE